MSDYFNFTVQPLEQQHEIKVCRRSHLYTSIILNDFLVEKVFADGCVYEYNIKTQENIYKGKVPKEQLIYNK